MNCIEHYFPKINEQQREQFSRLYMLYSDWNSKINLISRKDIEHLYEKHVLHSLSIAKVISFTEGSKIMDVGTGGGFPGIPLAILFPASSFHLVDSIGKKVRVAEDVANQLGLQNVICKHGRVEEEKQLVDFIVSRAVMPLSDLVKISRKNIAKQQQNSLPNGFLCLKGGDLQAEIQPYRQKAIQYELRNYFTEEYFQTKKIVYLPV